MAERKQEAPAPPTAPQTAPPRRSPVRLVEACAGSAAVTLVAMGGALPLYYRGGKRRHAKAILAVLREVAAEHYAGLADAGAPFGAYTLNEPGMFGEFWQVVGSAETRTALVKMLDDMHRQTKDQSPRVVWQSLAARLVPTGITQRVATWVALQRHSYGGRPVELDVTRPPSIDTLNHRPGAGRLWRTGGFIGAAADRGAQREAALAAGNADARRWAKSSPTLADLAAAIEALPQALLRPQDGGAMLTTRIDARRLHLALLDAPSVVYIDPPYAGTSCGYAAELSRANVLTIAHRFITRGYPVVVSEAEPLPALDCGTVEHRQLAGPIGGGRTASKQQAEWLTIYRPARTNP